MYRCCLISLFLFVSAMTMSSCQHSPSGKTTYRIEAEKGFENLGEYQFVSEIGEFYSGKQAIMLSGATPIGGSGKVVYHLNNLLAPGTYRLSIYYNDENDGHAPITVMLDDQTYSFVMDGETPSAFAAATNTRSSYFQNVTVGKNSVLSIAGTVDRYKSEHKELVRLDYFEFTQM